MIKVPIITKPCKICKNIDYSFVPHTCDNKEILFKIVCNICEYEQPELYLIILINIEDAKSTINLCDNCIYEFAECDGNPKFGTGFGNDNVYECDKFILSNI